jgi:prophage tail gpP-like protein
VTVTSPKLGCDELLLIVSTRHIEDEQGTRTEVTVTRPDAFKLIPLINSNDFVIPGAAS